MAREAKYFTLSLDSLRAIGGWAADCAERALAVYELQAASDQRPRAARLRSLAMAAHAAAREIGDPTAAAARAAASAYTHPLRDVEQTKHIVGPRPMLSWHPRQCASSCWR